MMKALQSAVSRFSSVLPRGLAPEAPSVSASFCGLIKGVKYRFTLKDGTWDFPGDAGNFGLPLE